MNDSDEDASEEAGGRGARIHMQDRRLSKALAWLWGILGSALVGSVLLAANNLYQLNVTVAQMASSNAMAAAQIADHETRLRQMERDVSTLEGKVFRGVSGYEEPVSPRTSHGR
jgi:hypothetical protein